MVRMRFVTAAEAASTIHSGDRVYLHGGAATPHHLVDALVARAAHLREVEIVHMHTEGPASYVEPEYEGIFRHNALFIGPNVRKAVQEGRADYTPIFLSEIPGLFLPDGPLPLDVAMIHVTPPDDAGMCSFGVSVDCALAAAKRARLVIALVNPLMPRSRGHAFPASAIDLAVAWEGGLPTYEAGEISEEARAIGWHVASLIEDGATLQMGIGAIPNGVLAALRGHRDLGVHTEMFSDGLLPLVRSGAVNGSRKTLHPGVIVSTFAMGSQELYRFIDDNPAIELHPVEHTNDVDVIARNSRMTAINSALSVDLTGQVVADSIGPRFYSGIGGQLDFIRGAARSVGGLPIIAMPSTARDGQVSRICPQLPAGSAVVTTRGDVHWVVTEFGARNLYGRTIRERAAMLIEIAHPRFRAELEDEAGKLGYLTRRPR